MWDDDAEEASTRQLLTMSDTTARALKDTFSRPLNNQICLQARRPYAFPDVETTKCPKLNPIANEQKQADAMLAKLQSYILDAVAPLVHIVEEARNGAQMGEQATEAAKAAIALLSNASSHVSRER